MLNWIRGLNRVYRSEPSLYQRDFTSDGFEWIDAGDAEQSVLAFVRKSPGNVPILVIINFTPVPRRNFLVGIPNRGIWREVLNSDAQEYGGSGWGNLGCVESVPVASHGRVDSLNLNLPPLATVMLRWEGHG
jgi:1,4-alpha-glucan branching enzyme